MKLFRILRLHAEAEQMKKTIIRELEKPENVEELDFTAGYILAKIRAKHKNRFLTQNQADKLSDMLCANYEIIRARKSKNLYLVQEGSRS